MNRLKTISESINDDLKSFFKKNKTSAEELYYLHKDKLGYIVGQRWGHEAILKKYLDEAGIKHKWEGPCDIVVAAADVPKAMEVLEMEPSK